MASWKKVIVSGSAAELASLTLDTAFAVAQGGTGASVDLTGGKLDAMSSAATQVQTASPTVNFNISTVDAAGFDQLLTSRKGTITTIINDAMNTQGKMGII